MNYNFDSFMLKLLLPYLVNFNYLLILHQSHSNVIFLYVPIIVSNEFSLCYVILSIIIIVLFIRHFTLCKMRNMFFHYIFVFFLMFAYLCCVFSLTPPCALNSLTIHAPPMKNDIIGICYTISVIPSSIMLYVALTRCIVKLLLFILSFVSLYLCLTKCYSSIRYSFQELYTFFSISTL